VSVATIGWIGAGIMGRPMAAHLLRASYTLVVAERAGPGVAALVAAGAQTMPTPRALAEGSDAVFTMLPDSATVENVVLGYEGVLTGLRPGCLFVDMSSIAPATARRIAAEIAATGAHALDAPVSGGEQGAIEATLSVMAGGTVGAFTQAEPLLRHLAALVVHVGGPGAGQVAKACNQIAVAVTIEAVAEALALAEAAGADPSKVLTALMGGLAASRVMERYGPRMLESRYEPGARASLHQKDLMIATGLAADAGIELPALQLVLRRFSELVARDPGLDHSAISHVDPKEKPAARNANDRTGWESATAYQIHG
jgi:2-hydroxy-3-oxopropionate reductase